MTVTSGSVFGGSSAGDTAAGNDTLSLTSAGAGRVDMGGGTNKISAVGRVQAGTIVLVLAMTPSPLLMLSQDALELELVMTAFSLLELSLEPPAINAGAGNDTLQFTSTVSSASIIGGAGMTPSASSTAYTTATAAEGSTYFYGSSGGTDTLFYAGNTTTATFLTFNVLDSLYDSVSTEVRAGTGISVVGTAGTTTRLSLM